MNSHLHLHLWYHTGGVKLPGTYPNSMLHGVDPRHAQRYIDLHNPPSPKIQYPLAVTPACFIPNRMPS